jgi:hypothetical protein
LTAKQKEEDDEKRWPLLSLTGTEREREREKERERKKERERERVKSKKEKRSNGGEASVVEGRKKNTFTKISVRSSLSSLLSKNTETPFLFFLFHPTSNPPTPSSHRRPSTVLQSAVVSVFSEMATDMRR